VCPGRARLSRGGGPDPESEIVHGMWVSKISELIGSSSVSFEDAARHVLGRANRTLRGITGIEVLSKSVKVSDGEIAEYRVHLRLLFDVAPRADQHW